MHSVGAVAASTRALLSFTSMLRSNISFFRGSNDSSSSSASDARRRRRVAACILFIYFFAVNIFAGKHDEELLLLLVMVLILCQSWSCGRMWFGRCILQCHRFAFLIKVVHAFALYRLFPFAVTSEQLKWQLFFFLCRGFFALPPTDQKCFLNIAVNFGIFFFVFLKKKKKWPVIIVCFFLCILISQVKKKISFVVTFRLYFLFLFVAFLRRCLPATSLTHVFACAFLWWWWCQLLLGKNYTRKISRMKPPTAVTGVAAAAVAAATPPPAPAAGTAAATESQR